MASLFERQAAIYAQARPTYPLSLFAWLSSLTRTHKRAWDAGTGSGQAAVGAAQFYEEVIATDVSEKQLQYAKKMPNITYTCTSPCLTRQELDTYVGGEGTIDLVISAQAIHWFDLENFYSHVRRVLRKPSGIIALWCYTNPKVSPKVDAILDQLYETTLPYWEAPLKYVNQGYTTLPFPFEPVPPNKGTGPFTQELTKETSLEGYLGFLKSWSAINTAKLQGHDLLTQPILEAFENAWGSTDQVRTLIFPMHLRLGTCKA